MYEADGFHFLEVQKVAAEHNGMYSVTVQNLAGSDTAEAELEVFEKPKLLTRSGPEWEQTLQDLTVEEGDVGVELVCTCRELTQPSVKWFHNEKEVFSGFHFKLQHVAQTATLTIKEVKDQDAGEFKCIMTGKNGELVTSCILAIKSPEKMEPPVFVKELHDMDVEEGDKLKLDVEVKGTPLIRVSWYHNSTEITHDNPHYLVASIGRIHTLTLLLATPQSSGEYVCEAYNNIGGTETFCFIDVREIKHPEPPAFVTCPMNQSAPEGETVTFTCQVKGQPLPTVLWKKGGVIIVTDQKFKITRIQDCHKLTIYNTNHTDAGEYICYIYNTKGDMSYTCKLQVSDQRYLQTVDSMSSRPDHSQEMQLMLQSDQDNAGMGQHEQTFQEPSKGFKIQRMLHLEDRSKNAEVMTTRTSQSISNEYTEGSTASTTILQTAIPHHLNVATIQQKPVYHLQSHSNDNNTELDYIKPVKVRNDNSDFQPNIPDSINNPQFVPSKVHQKAEGTNNMTRNNLTNYKVALKSGQKSPLPDPEKSSTQSHVTDYRTVLSQYKTKELTGDKSVTEGTKNDMANSELNYSPVTKTPTSLQSHSGGYTSVTYSTPSLSSPFLLPSDENGGQTKFAFRRDASAAKYQEPISVKKSVDISGDANVLSSHSVEHSQIAGHSWRRGRKDHISSSSSPHHNQEMLVTQERNVITSRSGKENENLEGPEPGNVMPRNNILSRSLDSSETLTADPKDQPSLELKNATVKHEFQKVNLPQLSARKLSISEFNPSAPQSEGLKLEVTSVSATVPQKHSLSSPRLHSESHNMTVPVQLSAQSTADDLYIRQEDDDVFTATSKERRLYHGPKHSSGADYGLHSIKSSTATQETVPWGITDVKKDGFSKSYAQDSFNQTNDTTGNQMKNSTIRFSEKLPYYHDQYHQKDGEVPVVFRNEAGSYSDTSALTSHMSSTVIANNDFRNVKLKSAAPKTKEQSELTGTKFLSKSTESVFTDIKLKPVSETNDNWRKSKISTNAERIRTNSKSTDLSKLFSTPSYQNPSRNSFVPKTTVAATSAPFRFSNYQKSSNDDAKSKSFHQPSKYQKPVQSSKLRSSAGKYEKALPGGVSRSNSHRKSKGIGAKFEAAIKDLNISKQVPYTSLHTAKNNQSDKKPSRQQNTIGYNSGRMSENIQNWKSAEVKSSEKVLKKTVNASSNSNTALTSGSENYLQKISDRAKKRQSLNLDNSATFTSNNNTFKNKERHSTINALIEEDKLNIRTTGSHNVNKVSVPDAIRDEQNLDWLGRKSINDTDVRIRASSGIYNQQDIPGHEWLRHRSPINSMHAEFSQADPGILEHDNRIGSKDQQAVASSTDGTKLASRTVETARESFQISNMKPQSQSLPKNAGLYNSEKLSYNMESSPGTAFDLPQQVNDDVRTSEISKTSARPKRMAQVQSFSPLLTSTTTEAAIRNVSPPTMVAKSQLILTATNVTNPEIPVTSASTNAEIKMLTPSRKMSGAIESKLEESERANVSLMSASISNGLKGKTDATSVPASIESPPRQDTLESQPDDLQSQMYRPSRIRQRRPIPFYPINDTDLPPNNEPLKLSMYDSESLLSTASISSSSSDASNVTIDSGYTRNHLRSLVDNEKIHVVSAALHPESTENWNTLVSTKGLEGNRNQIAEFPDTENNLWKASKAKESTIQPSRQSDQANTNTQKVFTDSERLFDMKENEFTNVTNDSNAPIYISRRRQRQFENNVAARSDSVLTSETGLADKESFDASDIINPLTSDMSSLRKQMPFSYESSAADTSRTRNTNARQVLSTSEVKSDFTNGEQTLNTEPRKDIRSSLRDSVYEPEKPNEEHKFKSKDNEENLSMGQRESISTDRIRYKFRDKLNKMNNVGDETAILPDRTSTGNSYESDLNQDWRSSRLQHSEFSPDKKVVHSSVSHQNELRLSNSREEVTSPVLKTTFTPPPSSHFTTTTSAGVPVLLTSPSTTDRQQQYCPPSFPIPLHDCSVMYGSKTVLLCHVAGNPRPDVKWFLNQKKIEPSDKVEIVYSDVIAQLTIQETSREHTGDYSCWARNTLGTVSTHCTLSLEDFHSHVTPDNNTDFLKQADIKSDISKMSTSQTNNTGPDQVTTNIFIKGAPDTSLGKPHVCVQDRTSASLSWCGPLSSEKSQEIYYIIEAKTDKDKTWDVIIPHCKEFFCIIQGLKSDTAYQFRVLAANKYGVSLPSESSETVMIPERISLTSDYDYEEELPFKPRDVVINTKDKFEALYEVEKEIGKGKFGVVFKCKQKSDGTIWAAKVVRCREKEKIGLRREIDIMNKLRHPKLLLLWDAFESPRQMVLVMEYVGAGELFERVISEDFILTENDCIHFVRQICEGVAYLHDSNILHLDLKPENILCIAENSNRIKIIDFGLAQFYKPGQSTRVLVGTPEFIAPEVINYDEISFETDMWSLGVICYVLLSGLSPFLGDSDEETLANVTEAEYDFDDDAFDEISDLAKDFISQLLVKKKEKRILTGRCLAHPWLNQDDVDGVPVKPLSTEKLKKFMIRRKWLKTGNAVKAVSRLLKSNSLSGFGVLDQNSSIDSDLDTPSPNNPLPVSMLQRTAEEVIDDEESKCKVNSVENIITSEISKHLEHAPEKSLEAKLSSLDGNHLSPRDQRNASRKDASSKSDSADLIPNVGKTESSSFSSTSATFRQLDDSLSASGPANKSSLQINNRKTTEMKQVTSVSTDGVLPQAPVFTKAMIRCKTCTGDVARFDVVVSGNPFPQVTWYFEDEEIHSDTRHTLNISERTKSFSLIIRNIEEEDEGEYTCKAVNSQGETTCAADLTVLQV